MIRGLARRALAPVFSRVEARVALVDARVTRLALTAPIGTSTSGASCDCLESASFATTVYLLRWAQPRGGIPEISVEGRATRVDLFSATTGFRRIVLYGFEPERHRIRISATGQSDSRSQGTEVAFHRAITDIETSA